MTKSRIANTFQADGNVTYQILAYRHLNGHEAQRAVVSFLNKTAAGERPGCGDIVIINTAIGLRRN